MPDASRSKALRRVFVGDLARTVSGPKREEAIPTLKLVMRFDRLKPALQTTDAACAVHVVEALGSPRLIILARNSSLRFYSI